MNQFKIRRLNLPPPGRPNWIPIEKLRLNLLYISWGRRNYGENPIPVSMHDGWTYFVILDGSPSLVLSERTILLKRGEFIIMGPNCSYGLIDKRSGSCNILSWIWKEQPQDFRGFKIENTSSIRGSLSTSHLKRIKELHARSREETQSPDDFSQTILDGIRRELDGFLARLAAGKSSANAATAEWRLHLALEWLQKQIGASNPVQSLCDYLQVSPSTLNRLFYSHLGCSPKEHIHKVRMEYALQLKPDYQIKEIAYLFGYKHANDLSRALSHYCRNRK